jgi:hypothetical protein
MMNSFKNWYVRNQDAITWFIIGWLSLSCINSLAAGNLVWAAISAGLAWLNYKLASVRLR